MSERTKRIEAIFHAASELNSPEERERYLNEACGGDADLRREVVALLQAAPAGNELFQAYEQGSLQPRSGSISSVTEQAGTVIGRYKLLEQIGEGGMGVVYMAQQREPVVRKVALKIIKAGMDTGQVVARFEAERQALALMDHPNIAKVLDGGETETGRPYFVMDLVQGLPITQFCDETKLSTQERLELFLDVCSAIQHAHQKGIIHRDIKPSNILVTLHGDKPVPKVIDFGIAKATQQPLTEKTLFTQFQQFLGTPAYMSPEQASLSGLDIDTRSDIYALGVLLYELLTGKTPFDGKQLLQAGLDEMRRIILEKDPVRPSTCLSTLEDHVLLTLAKRRQTDASKLVHLLRGDLDWILMKCLEKERARRYESANGLALDLQHYLANEPVAAGPPGNFYRVQKFVRRNQLACAATAAILAVVIVGSVVSAIQTIRATRSDRLARVEAKRASEEATRADRHRLIAEARLFTADMNLVEQALQSGNLVRARNLLEAHRPQPGLPDFRSFEWRYFWKQSQGNQETTLRGHGGEVSGLSFSPDGQTLVSCGADSVLKLWNLRTRREIATLRGHTTWANNAVFSPDGRIIASASDDATVKLWDVAGQREVAMLAGHLGKVFDLRFSPDGATLASCGEDKRVRIWDVASRKELAALPHAAVALSCDYSRDGKFLATGGRDQCVTLWELPSHRVVGTLRGGDHEVQRMAFAPDSRMLATATEGESIRLWDVANRKEIAVLKGDTARFTYVSFSPDGKTLAASSRDGTVRLWDVASRRETATMRGHAAGIWLVEFSPDGKTLATGGMDGTVRLWDAVPPKAVESSNDSASLVWRAAFHPNRPTVTCWESSAATIPAAALTFFDVAGQRLGALELTNDVIMGFAHAPRGDRLVTWSADGAVHVWNTQANQMIGSFKPPITGINGAALAPDGTTVFVWGMEPVIKVFDATSYREIATLRSGSNAIPSTSVVKISSDGKILASVGERGSQVTLWDLIARRELAVLRVAGSWVTALAFSPDNRLLAAANQDSTITMWDAQSRRELAVLNGHASTVNCLEFSPDSKALATGSQDNTVKLWNCITLQQVATLRGHPRGVSSVSFSYDGELLASAAGERKFRLWRAASFAETDRPFESNLTH